MFDSEFKVDKIYQKLSEGGRGFMKIYMYNQTLNKYFNSKDLQNPNCDTKTSFDKSFLSPHH